MAKQRIKQRAVLLLERTDGFSFANLYLAPLTWPDVEHESGALSWLTRQSVGGYETALSAAKMLLAAGVPLSVRVCAGANSEQKNFGKFKPRAFCPADGAMFGKTAERLNALAFGYENQHSG